VAVPHPGKVNMVDIGNFFEENPVFGSVIMITGIFIFAAVMMIGRSFTLESGEVLTPQYWQILNAKKAYQQELNALVADAQEMSALLNSGQPDPIQGQIITDAVQAPLIDEGHPALREERTALLNAAEAVRSWSQGALLYENAQMIMNETIHLLQLAEIE
jgi:hypothetical protein